MSAALLAGGCGGSPRRAAVPRRTHVGATPPAGPAPRHAGELRWLVPTTGRPPSVAAENAQPGTRAWRLPGPAVADGGAARGYVEGYVSSQAVAHGQRERVYVNAPGARTVTLRLFRIGWYGGKGGRLVAVAPNLPVRRQPACRHVFSTGLTECHWHPTLSFTVPRALPSGVYTVRMSTASGAARDCLFVLRGTGAPLLVEIPTATYEAYNAWGGDSLYPGGSRRVGVTGTTQGVEVSYDRPYDSATGAGEFFSREVAMVRFLERYRYPVQYTTIESVDAVPSQVRGRRALLDVGHSEYWSQGDERAFAGARDRGTSLLFFSSDTMAWRVRFAPAGAGSSERGARDHIIVGWKEHVALDRGSPPSGAFPGMGAAVVGSAFTGCITPRVQIPGPPQYRYFPWEPVLPLRPSWLFAHTGITGGTRVPGVVGYEVDAQTGLSPAGTRTVGFGAPVCMSRLRVGLAQSTLYTARSGALVFASGTLGWEFGLYPVAAASPDVPHAPDPRLVRVTRNLIAHVLKATRG